MHGMGTSNVMNWFTLQDNSVISADNGMKAMRVLVFDEEKSDCPPPKGILNTISTSNWLFCRRKRNMQISQAAFIQSKDKYPSRVNAVKQNFVIQLKILGMRD